MFNSLCEILQLPMSSSFNGDILGNSGTDSLRQTLRPTVSLTPADFSERVDMLSRRESATTVPTKTEVPIHLVSTTNQLHKQGGVQQQIPTKLATLKSKDKSSKIKGSQRTDSSGRVTDHINTCCMVMVHLCAGSEATLVRGPINQDVCTVLAPPTHHCSAYKPYEPDLAPVWRIGCNLPSWGRSF